MIKCVRQITQSRALRSVRHKYDWFDWVVLISLCVCFEGWGEIASTTRNYIHTQTVHCKCGMVNVNTQNRTRYTILIRTLTMFLPTMHIFLRIKEFNSWIICFEATSLLDHTVCIAKTSTTRTMQTWNIQKISGLSFATNILYTLFNYYLITYVINRTLFRMPINRHSMSCNTDHDIVVNVKWYVID